MGDPATELLLEPARRSRRGRALTSGLVLSAAAYAVGMAHDVASARGLPRVKPPLLIGMVALHLAAFARLARGGPRLPVPGPIRALSGLMFLVGLGGMFYSIFVEIPLRKAWIDRGHTDELVTTGTYALVRHPGVLWLSAAIPFGALATRSCYLLLASPLIALGDVVHVWFQDRFILPHVFGQAYRDYQEQTPFVIPNRESVDRFARTFRGGADIEESPALEAAEALDAAARAHATAT